MIEMNKSFFLDIVFDNLLMVSNYYKGVLLKQKFEMEEGLFEVIVKRIGGYKLDVYQSLDVF